MLEEEKVHVKEFTIYHKNNTNSLKSEWNLCSKCWNASPEKFISFVKVSKSPGWKNLFQGANPTSHKYWN